MCIWPESPVAEGGGVVPAEAVLFRGPFLDRRWTHDSTQVAFPGREGGDRPKFGPCLLYLLGPDRRNGMDVRDMRTAVRARSATSTRHHERGGGRKRKKTRNTAERSYQFVQRRPSP